MQDLLEELESCSCGAPGTRCNLHCMPSCKSCGRQPSRLPSSSSACTQKLTLPCLLWHGSLQKSALFRMTSWHVKCSAQKSWSECCSWLQRFLSIAAISGVAGQRTQWSAPEVKCWAFTRRLKTPPFCPETRMRPMPVLFLCVPGQELPPLWQLCLQRLTVKNLIGSLLMLMEVLLPGTLLGSRVAFLLNPLPPFLQFCPRLTQLLP